jgi:hypothetical protein
MAAKKEPYIRLEINTNHQDFTDFYDTNKEIIYKSIVEVFEGLKTSRKKTLKLLVVSQISGLEWDTEFNLSKTETKILVRDVIPYFEQIEDYETCLKIKNLHYELTM